MARQVLDAETLLMRPVTYSIPELAAVTEKRAYLSLKHPSLVVGMSPFSLPLGRHLARSATSR